ncbi:MAG: cation:proton antiporter, partial [Candidatus Micrarchaeota archaeon]
MIEFFLVIGLTLFMGFAATILFERTRISQVLILMLFGFVLGPMTGFIDASEDSIIISISQFIATLALIILLFDGGMMLDIFSVVKALPRSTVFTFVTFMASTLLLAGFAVFALGWPLLHGLLLGTVLGGISSAIVIAMIDKAGVSDETKAMLTVEASITDALCIIGAMVVIEIIITSSIGAGDIGNLLLG